MKKTLLVYPPFCTPASPPYSITNICAFLKGNLPKGYDVDVLDLNIFFHYSKYKEYNKYYKNLTNNFNSDEYKNKTNEFMQKTRNTYRENNKIIYQGGEPELVSELLQEITKKKYDVIAFSVVYSSQAFYCYKLISELKKQFPEIKCVIGGPAVNKKLKQTADEFLSNEFELLKYIMNEEVDHEKLMFDNFIDFSLYDLEKYFVSEPVISFKTSNTCYYQGCAFCNHHNNQKYFEFPLENIMKSIKKNNIKNVFFVDDMIPKGRLLKISESMKKFDTKYMCQLRPTKEFDKNTLQTLFDSGLRVVLWGVESGNEETLKLMNKGTNPADVSQVLKDAHEVGIQNVVYVMFGFPKESENRMNDTLEFLQKNKENIDLCSYSFFGLLKDTPVYDNPEKFGIEKINVKERTILDPQISYKMSKEFNDFNVKKFKNKITSVIDEVGKYPRTMNFFREHMLNLQNK